MRRICMLIGTLPWIALTTVTAQHATFIGLVRDSVTSAPLTGAAVSILGMELASTTDVEGRFELSGIPGGDVTLLVQGVGYRSGLLQLELTVDHPVTFDLGSIVLAPMVAELEPIVVEAEVINERLRSVGFFNRMQSETGTFITKDAIDKLSPRRTSEILRRVAGFQTYSDGAVASRRGVASINQGFQACGVDYYIDGIHSMAPNVDVVIPTAIAAIEVYTGAATIPPGFRISGNPKCGVVVIWTRGGEGTPY